MPTDSPARAAVILAAGQGSRMKSPLPKVLHSVGGRSMLDRAIDAAENLGCTRIVVVVGAHSPPVGEHVRRRMGDRAVALQDPPLGTGHAVLAAHLALEGFKGDVVVTYADVPLLEASAIEPLFELRAGGADLAVLGFEADDPGAYGRLITSGDHLEKIVEAKDATAEELAISLCNSGVLVGSWPTLLELLSRVGAANSQGEYYLTDVVGLARAQGLSAKVARASETEVMGVNAQSELAQAEQAFQSRARTRMLTCGVSMIAPETVWLSWDTEIGAGTRIEPNVVLGERVKIGEGAWIRAFSHIEGAQVAAGAHVGPFARLRPGARIGEGAHVGNFVEVKNASLGPGAKANHLAYLGDGDVGARANIGAGVIFCNYDGFAKSRTIVGESAFVGSNSALVAPVNIGPGAYIGSGSVITADVSPDALALARAPQIEKAAWAAKYRELRSRRKPQS